MAQFARIPLSTLALVLLGACQPAAETAAGTQATSASTAQPAAAAATAEDTAPASAPGTAGATELDEATQSLVKGSVGIAASLVACDMGTRAQADQGIASQRASYVARGIDGAAYDRAVADAWQETTAKFAAASPAQKTQACASMAKLGSQLEQMAKDVQGMKADGQ